MDKSNERKPLRIKNLAELKRTVKPGVEMLTTSHAYHKDMIGLIRQVKQVQTVGFYSVVKDQPNHRYSVCNYGKGFLRRSKKPRHIFLTAIPFHCLTQEKMMAVSL